MAAITNHKEPPSGVFSSRTVAIIPAGGVGRRMDSPLPKQYLPLGGVPLLVHTLRCFEYSPSIDLVVLVVPGEDVPWVEEEIVGLFNLQKVKKVVAGGTQRQDSVRNGLMNLEGWEELVVVHDGVRPFVSPTLIERCLELARRFGAAIPGVPASDTVKECRDGVVEHTLSRERLWLVQTPQVFRREIIVTAYHRAYADGFYGTDDAALVERIGGEVRVVNGDHDNIKVTHPRDLIYAEWLLTNRRVVR